MASDTKAAGLRAAARRAAWEAKINDGHPPVWSAALRAFAATLLDMARKLERAKEAANGR